MTSQSPAAVFPATTENHHGVHEALRVEYRAMASWYDSFWADYLTQTFPLPLRLVRMGSITACQIKQQDSVQLVDVGCGTGEFLRRLHDSFGEDEIMKKKVSCHGIEPSPEMLEQARNKSSIINWTQAAAESIPLEDASVDMVCSTNAFHFFRDKAAALQQMHRILKPTTPSNNIINNNGDDDSQTPSLIITDWCADYWLVRIYHFLERFRWNSWHGFAHKYPGPLRSSELQSLVEEAGFVNVRVETYRVRVFVCCWWGMQTVTADKNK